MPNADHLGGGPQRHAPVQRFPVSIHPVIRDKPDGWRSEFSCGWERRELTLAEILALIREGRALIFAGMVSDHRTSAAFESSSLLAVDVDHGARLQDFLDSDTELRRACCAFYTTASHQRVTESNPKGEDRFRLLFQVSSPITEGETYNAAVRLLIGALGGDAACSDSCRIFYGNRQSIAEVLDEGAILSDDWIKDAADQAEEERIAMQAARDAVEDRDVQRALWIFDNEVIAPTNDGERNKFQRVTAAAASFASDEVFEAWQRWAAGCHHSKERRNTTRRYFDGFHRSTPNTLFFLADSEAPEWRQQLPEKLRASSKRANSSLVSLPRVAGYSEADFMGEEDEAPVAAGGLLDYAKSGGGSVKKPKSQSSSSGNTNDGDDDEDDEDDEDKKVDKNSARYLKFLAAQTFPSLRWNDLQKRPEYIIHQTGEWQELGRDDAYMCMSARQGDSMAAPAKVAAYDAALAVAKERPYNPARFYLEGLKASDMAPSSHFEVIASRYLGATESPDNPRMECGRLYADVVMERFMIGAVARALNPGVDHDWMPIIIGAQGVGKTRFINALPPPLPAGAGKLCATATGSLTKLAERPADLHQGWLVLLDEFERYTTSMGTGVEKLKAMISTSTDSSDRKYEQSQAFPRAFVLIGSANSTTFLRDPTGNRRFKPIICGSKAPGYGPIRIDLLAAERDGLWKAAVTAYFNGERHHFTSEESRELSEVIKRFETESALVSMVREACVSGRAESTQTLAADGRVTYATHAFFDAMEVPANYRQIQMPDLEKALESLGFTKEPGPAMSRLWAVPEDPVVRDSLKFDPSHPRAWEAEERRRRRSQQGGDGPGTGRRQASDGPGGW